MKKLILSLCILLAASAASAQAVKDEVAFIRSIFGKEKKDLIRQFMNLNEAESAKFWPIYEEYTAAQQNLADDRIAAIGDYANQYSGLTDDQASTLANRIFKNDQAVLKLQNKYFKKMSKSLTPLKAAQFMQADQYIQTTIKSATQDLIPFIGEFEQKNKH